jgi:hypothetical protein
VVRSYKKKCSILSINVVFTDSGGEIIYSK